jgi:hypothetical protein
VDPRHDGVYFSGGPTFTDENLGLQHRPIRKGETLAIRASGFGVDEDLPVHLSIGSGVHGSTYVGLREDGGAVVPMISLYRKHDRLVWNWTPGPGARRRTDEPAGQTVPPEGLAQCAGCHSTVGRRRFSLETQTLGIGCERCHGPAKEHLERVKVDLDGVRSGAIPSAGMPRLGTLSGPQVLARCNTCHRPLGRTAPDGLPDDLARSQALGIMLSRCYQGSLGKLSCVSCHDPHAPPARQAAHYERVCNSCHTGAPAEAPRCSVTTSRAGCIGCHMDREQMRQFNLATFANHWIRRRPGAPEPAPPAR